MSRQKPVRNARYYVRLVGGFILLLIILVYGIVPAAIGGRFVNPTRPDPAYDSPQSYDLGDAYQEVTFPGPDDSTMHAWALPSRNRASVILVHGIVGTRTYMIPYADFLAEHGYGVLLFDLREPNTGMGWQAHEDLLAAADYLATRDDVDPDRIGVLGISLGAQTALHAGGVSPALKAIVADGAGWRAYSDYATMIDTPGEVLAAPSFWMLYQSQAWATAQKPPPSLLSLTPNISPNAVFFISGLASGDEEVAYNRLMFEAASEPKRLWEIPDMHHVEGIIRVPAEYEQRVIIFFDEFLLGANPPPP